MLSFTLKIRHVLNTLMIHSEIELMKGMKDEHESFISVSFLTFFANNHPNTHS